MRGPIIKKLTIIGTGLIGGSLGLACREEGLAERVWGHSRKESNLKRSVELGLIDGYSLDLKEAVMGADMVALALPVESLIAVGEKMAPYIERDTVVTDVGSAKQVIVERMEGALPRPELFVGAHPIAGTEDSGPEAALSGLFKGRPLIMTPTEKTDHDALNLVRAIWERAGALVSEMDPLEHDRLLATISHLPHMAAYALVNALSKAELELPGLFTYAAGGFKDFSRIASSSPVMWKEICLQNGSALIEALEQFSSALSEIRLAVQAKDGERLENLFQQAKRIRDRL